MREKRCPHCKQVKDEDCFWKNTRYYDGLGSRCKKCETDIKREKRKNNIGCYGKEKRRRKKCVMEHYGKACAWCGFGDWRALTIDHVDGDGAEHRKKVISANLYRWLIKNNFPPGFRILCMNCQFIKRHENQEWAKKKTVPG